MSDQDDVTKAARGKGQPIPADPIPTPDPGKVHPGQRLDQPIPSDPIPVPVSGKADPRQKQTAEFWAGKKGMLPDVFPGGAVGLAPGAKAIPGAVRMNIGAATARVAPRANPEHVKFAAAKAKHNWPVGVELTEEEFDAAVDSAYGPNSEVICR